MVVGTGHPSDGWKLKVSVLVWAKSETPISKITKTKRAGGMA
jgi:hypothetical protein